MATRWILDSTGLGDELNRALVELLELDQRRTEAEHGRADDNDERRRRQQQQQRARRRRQRPGGDAAAGAAAGWLHSSMFGLGRRNMSSDETLDSWCNPGRLLDHHQSSNSLPPIPEEYRPALNSVILHPHLWSDSSLRRSLRFLQENRASWPPQESFPSVACRLVRAAWPDSFSYLGGGHDVERFEANVPGVASGNMLEGAVQLHESLGWEGPYLQAALEELIELEGADPEGLRIVCAMMLKGSRQCRARKSFVFCAVVGRVAAVEGGFGSGDDDGEDPDSAERACRHLRMILASFIDEFKGRAFRSTFLEPTKMYFRAMDDNTMEGDVDVHGANVYLAVLASALGVALDRTPYLGDGVKGVVDFVDAGMSEHLRRGCWDPDRVGVSWESIPSSRGVHHMTPIPRNEFIFPGRTALDVATSAIDCSPFKSSARARLIPYIEQFCSYFAAPYVLRRLFSHLTGGTAGESAELAAEVAYRSMREAMRGPAPSATGCDDEKSWPENLRHFCWDVEADPAVFREDNARLFFAYVGVCRCDADVEDDYLDVDDGAEAVPETRIADCAADSYLDVD